MKKSLHTLLMAAALAGLYAGSLTLSASAEEAAKPAAPAACEKDKGDCCPAKEKAACEGKKDCGEKKDCGDKKHCEGKEEKKS